MGCVVTTWAVPWVCRELCRECVMSYGHDMSDVVGMTPRVW